MSAEPVSTPMTACIPPPKSAAAAMSRAGRWWAKLRRISSDPIALKSVLSLADQTLVSGTNFLTAIIVGRCCGQTALGAYFLALTVMLFVKGLQDQLIAGPYMIYCSRRQGDAARRYAGSLFVHQLVLIAGGTFTLAAAGVISFEASEQQRLFGLLSLVLPLYLLREFVRSACFAQLRLLKAFAVDGFVAVLQLGGLIAAAAYGLLDDRLALIILGVACGAAAIAWLLLRTQSFVITGRDTLADWRHNWAFGRWALAGQLLANTAPYALPWILSFTHGAVETGAYAAGNTITGFANIFVVGLSNFFCPRAAQAYAEGGRPALVRFLTFAATTFCCVLGPITLLALALGDQSTRLVFGAGFEGGALVAILMPAMFVNSLGMVAGNGLWAMERPRANFAADVCALCATMVATVSFVPTYGALGIAFATLAGATAGTIVRAWTLRSLLATEIDPAPVKEVA